VKGGAEGWEVLVMDHPLYAEGTRHLQAGDFQKAVECFMKLSRLYGEVEPIQEALEQAKFKAEFEAATRVRPKRWIIPWRGVLLYTLTLILLVLIGIQGVQVVNRQLAPALARAREERQLNQLLAEGKAFLESGRLDEAESRYKAVLAQVPDHPKALAGLEALEKRKEAIGLCNQAMAAYKAGDWVKARELFTELAIRSPGFCRAKEYIAEINRRLNVGDLLAQAEAAYEAGRWAEAAAQYEQIRAVDATYQRELVDERLFRCYLEMGRAVIEADPPTPDLVPQAVDFFTRALALRPRDAEAGVEYELASLYLAGQKDYAEGRWDSAAARLEALYNRRPGYLKGTVAVLLYDAYIRSGDAHRDRQDYAYAWEQYRKAAALSTGDAVLARGRMESVEPFLTPTPTATPTSTPTPTPTATPYYTPTPVPTPTPIPPLATLKNQILFFSDEEGKKGLWVMNPDGSNRRYLGAGKALQEEYKSLLERESWSPDGRYRVYVTTGESDKNPQIYIQGQVNEWGVAPTWRVTDFRRVCYDPVWSPDGSLIAFVSQERGSDDIWVVNPDGSNPRNLTPNTWEWDKHPSWAPDSTRIVFWSNRTGVKQIYVVDISGQNVQNISNTAWDEYDPLWVK
jgi:tetratricopeptide (TPR) repeat protein